MTTTFDELVRDVLRGGEVVLPPGRVVLTETVYLRSGTILRGAGAGTVLEASGDWPCLTVIDSDDTAAESVVIRDMTLTRSNTAGTPAAAQADSQGVLVCGDHVTLQDVVLSEHYDSVAVAASPAAASGRVTLVSCLFKHSNVSADTSRYHVAARNATVVVVSGCDVVDAAQTSDFYALADGTVYVYEGGAAGASVAKVFTVTNPATASATAVHAAHNAELENNFPGPFTNPDVPRNITATFHATWDGGDVTVVGTDALGRAQTEVLSSNPGATEAGVKIFAPVTSATKDTEGVAPAGASLGTGPVLGVAADITDTSGMLMVGATPEAVTIDATNDSFAPTSAPNGARDYTVLLNVAP